MTGIMPPKSCYDPFLIYRNRIGGIISVLILINNPSRSPFRKYISCCRFRYMGMRVGRDKCVIFFHFLISYFRDIGTQRDIQRAPLCRSNGARMRVFMPQWDIS